VGAAARILVVEDNELIRAEVTTILSLEGFEVIEAENGRDGLACLAAGLPDLILSDLMMPEMDGFAFLEAARTNARWARIPFVVLSARGEREAAERALALGARRFLIKPVDVQDLLDTVASTLGGDAPASRRDPRDA
jgi:CheY-like chemotaxis protein